MNDEVVAKRESWLERPLEPDEVKNFRLMMEEWERYKWAWKLVRKILVWSGGAIGVIWAARDMIGNVVSALIKALAP